MKKEIKRKSTTIVPQVESGLAEKIDKMQQQLGIIERKMDVLISAVSKPLPAPIAVTPSVKQFQQSGPAQGNGERRQENKFRERVLHKAICADCKKECEVPFKPSGERPVYCKECFSKRKAGNQQKHRPDNRPKEMIPVPVVHVDSHQAVEKKKPAEKKKPTVKKKPAVKRRK